MAGTWAGGKSKCLVAGRMNQGSSIVTINKLAVAKAISADALRAFGLKDTPDGVIFEYRTSTGEAARPRLRTAMRGADGSQWMASSALPIAVYSAPPGVAASVDPDDLLLVEGESDCWSAWLHGIAACGI